MIARVWAPGRVWQKRILPQEGESGKHHQRSEQHGKMQPELHARADTIRQAMSIAVASEQQHLKEKHAGGPHCRRSAKPGEKILADDELDRKQQERAEKDRDAVGIER